MLPSHRFSRYSLLNPERLYFRAADFESERYVIPIPGTLFAKKLPRLKELKYLGLSGSLAGMVKNVTS